MPACRPLPVTSPSNDQHASGIVGHDLEEVSAYLLRRAIFALEHKAGNRGNRFGDQQLLNLASLIDLSFPLLAAAAGIA